MKKTITPQLFERLPNGRYKPYIPPKPEPDDHTIYRRVGKKYVPIGLTHYNEHDLCEGLWLVRNRPGWHSMTNVDHYASHWGLTKVADIPVTDVTRFAAAEEIYRVIDKHLFERFGYTVENIAHQDLAEELVKLIVSLGQEK